MVKTSDLQESFFTCPELSRGERDYLIQKAQQSARTLVESARSINGPVLWQEAGAYKGVQMYKGEARNASAPGMKDEVHGGMNYACGAVSVNATLEEVAQFFDVSTTPTMKEFVSTQDDILDGVVLYTLVPPTPSNEHMHQITVKWFLGNMPSRLIKPRDFLTLECQDVFVDKTGRRGWVRSYHSVKLPCGPDLQDRLGYVRGAMYHSGYVFVESARPGWLDCIFSLQVNLKGNVSLPSALYWIAMKRRIKSIAGLSHALSERRLGKQSFLSDLELVPKHQRKRCNVCQSRFGVFLRRSRCRKCGEVVCHSCSEMWTINVAKVGATQVRVCLQCAQVTDKQALDNFSLVSEGPESSSVSAASDGEDNHHPHSNIGGFRRESMYNTHTPFRPHRSQDPHGLKPLDIPASLFDAPHRKGSKAPSSSTGSDYREDYYQPRRGPGPSPGPPSRGGRGGGGGGGGPQYERDNHGRGGVSGWGHEFDPRDRRYDPKFADCNGPQEPYDPRDRRYDPRDRGGDRDGRGYAPGYAPGYDRGYEDRRRDPRDTRPRQYDRRDPKEHGYDPRDPRVRQFHRRMDERHGRLNTTVGTDATSPLTDVSGGSRHRDDNRLTPRSLDQHTRNHGPQGPVSNHRGHPGPTCSRSNSRPYQADRPPPRQQPRNPPPPGPYRGPPTMEDMYRRSERAVFFRDDATWAQRSGMDEHTNYANLAYDFTTDKLLPYGMDDEEDDDEEEDDGHVDYDDEDPRQRGHPSTPRSNQSREDATSARAVGQDRDAQALAAAAMQYAGHQRKQSVWSARPPPSTPQDLDEFDDNRTITFSNAASSCRAVLGHLEHGGLALRRAQHAERRQLASRRARAGE